MERDPAKPASYYAQVLAAKEQAMAAYDSKNIPAIIWPNVQSALAAASAAYSAGAPVQECAAWLDRAVTYRLRFVVDGRKYHLRTFGIIDDYLEPFGAGVLVGGVPQMIEAQRRCTYDEPPPPPVEKLLEQFLAVLEGQNRPLDPPTVNALRGLDPGWALLPPVFESAAARDALRFGPALEAYLTEHWSPNADKWGREALRAKEPRYAGKWCFLAAALCRIAGGVPELSKKAASYVPVDLVNQ